MPRSSVAVQAPVVVSQSLTVRSSDAEASMAELCENATEWTLLLWPSSVAVQAPVIVSQSLTVQSSDAEASIAESCENATDWTQSLWPSSVAVQVPQSGSTCGNRDSQVGNWLWNVALLRRKDNSGIIDLERRYVDDRTITENNAPRIMKKGKDMATLFRLYRSKLVYYPTK